MGVDRPVVAPVEWGSTAPPVGRYMGGANEPKACP
jgi:hypothetical protein